jgi:hypothetical protein
MGRASELLARVLAPAGRQVRYAAGLEPGQAWRPAASTARLFFRPRYPGLEPWLNRRLPTWGPRLATGLRALPAASAAVGTGVGGHALATYLPDQARDVAVRDLGVANPDVADRVWWRAFRRQPEIWWRTLAPAAAGGDATPVGDLHRDLAARVMPGDLARGPRRGREQHPWLMAAADTMRSTTPFGAAQTLALQTLPPRDDPDYGPVIADALAARRDALANDPSVPRSPLARAYADVLLADDVLADPGVRPRLGSAALTAATGRGPEGRAGALLALPGRPAARAALQAVPAEARPALAAALPQGTALWGRRQVGDPFFNVSTPTPRPTPAYWAYAASNRAAGDLVAPWAARLREGVGPGAPGPVSTWANTPPGRWARGHAVDSLATSLRATEGVP